MQFLPLLRPQDDEALLSSRHGAHAAGSIQRHPAGDDLVVGRGPPREGHGHERVRLLEGRHRGAIAVGVGVVPETHGERVGQAPGGGRGDLERVFGHLRSELVEEPGTARVGVAQLQGPFNGRRILAGTSANGSGVSEARRGDAVETSSSASYQKHLFSAADARSRT